MDEDGKRKVWIEMAGRMVIIALLILMIMTACVRIDSVQTEDTWELKEELEYEELDLLDVRMRMGVGELKVQGGAEKLFQGEFIYGNERWKPMIQYDSRDKKGELRFEHPPIKSVNIGNNRYQWNIDLNDKPEMNLELELGVGRATLSLQSLNLNRVDIEMGVGEGEIYLDGSWEKDVEVYIKGGVGRAVVHLPKDMGVHVEVEGGIGSVNAKGLRADGKNYTNDLYGDAKHTMRLDIEAGIGEILLK
jgi:hypothetical protein